MNVGEYIKSLRLKHGLTQEELGAKVGVKRAAVQKWECGLTQNLKRTTIQKLSDVFGVSPSLFINAEVNTEIKSNTGIKIPVLGSVVAGIPLEAIEGLPISNSSFENVGGGTTLCYIIYGCKIK